MCKKCNKCSRSRRKVVLKSNIFTCISMGERGKKPNLITPNETKFVLKINMLKMVTCVKSAIKCNRSIEKGS